MPMINVLDAVTGETSTREMTAEEAQERLSLEQAAQAAAAVSAVTEGNRETITSRAASALQGNRDFLAVASPTAAQNAQQIKALTRQNTAVIRLLLGLLDGTD